MRMPEKEIATSETTPQQERRARSLALEKAYVHDVYDQIAPHFTDSRHRAWPRIKQFLLDLEPGSLVADVGCGNGKYLDVNPSVFLVGSDRCTPLISAARERKHEVMTCDNLQLPYRDEAFDAALSIAVIHHFATTERRVQAIKELTRIVRIGGRVMITVWAMEQRHRKFESQDVLVPWHQPVRSSSEDRGSSVERDVTSTTTSDDDILIYQAYRVQTSDSDSHPAASDKSRRRVKLRDGRRGKSFDSPPYSARRRGSNATSPSETCYSFVRRALQKLSASSSSPYSRGSRAYFYSRCRKPWFHDSSESNGPTTPPSEQSDKDFQHQDSLGSEGGDEMPIELRHLEEGFSPEEQKQAADAKSADQNRAKNESGQKSRSLGDILSIIPSFLRGRRLTEKEIIPSMQKRISTASDPREYVIRSEAIKNGFVRSNSAAACVTSCHEEVDPCKQDVKTIKSIIDDAFSRTEAKASPSAYPCAQPFEETETVSEESVVVDSATSFKDSKEDAETKTSLTSSDIVNGNSMIPDNNNQVAKNNTKQVHISTAVAVNKPRSRMDSRNAPNGLTNYLVKEVLSRKYSTGAWEDSLKRANSTISRVMSESRAIPSDVTLDKVGDSPLVRKVDKADCSRESYCASCAADNRRSPSSRTKNTLDCLSKTNPRNAFLAQMNNNSSQDSEYDDCDSGTILTSYYSMPELHTFCQGIAPQGGICSVIRQKVTKDHPINFLPAAHKTKESCKEHKSIEEEEFVDKLSPEVPDKEVFEEPSENDDAPVGDASTPNTDSDRHSEVPEDVRNRLVKRSMSVDNSGNSPDAPPIVRPRRFSASAAQGLQQIGLGFKLGLSKSLSKGSSLKSDTSVDSEESIISVIQRKTGQSMQSDTSVDSEESFASVIQRSASEIEALAQNREVSFRFLSRSTQASPLTITSTAGTSSECSPAQSIKTLSWSSNSEPHWKHELMVKYADARRSETVDVIAALLMRNKDAKILATESPPPTATNEANQHQDSATSSPLVSMRKDMFFLPISDCDEVDEEDVEDAEESKGKVKGDRHEEEEEEEQENEEKEKDKQEKRDKAVDIKTEERTSPEGAADSPPLSPKASPTTSRSPDDTKKADAPILPPKHKEICRISDWLTNQPVAEEQNCTYSSICSTLEGSEPVFSMEKQDSGNSHSFEFSARLGRRNSGDISARYSLLHNSGAHSQWKPTALRRHSLATCTLTANAINRLPSVIASSQVSNNQKRTENQRGGLKSYSMIRSPWSSLDTADSEAESETTTDTSKATESIETEATTRTTNSEISVSCGEENQQQKEVPTVFKKTEDMILSEIARDLFECSRSRILDKARTSASRSNKSVIATSGSRKNFLEESIFDKFNIFGSRKNSLKEENEAEARNDLHNKRNRFLTKNSFNSESFSSIGWLSSSTSKQSMKTSSFSEEDSEDNTASSLDHSEPRYIENYLTKQVRGTNISAAHKRTQMAEKELQRSHSTDSSCSQGTTHSSINCSQSVQEERRHFSRPGILKDTTSLSGIETGEINKHGALLATKSNSVPHVESILHKNSSSPRRRLVQQKSVEIVEKPTFIDGQKTSVASSLSLDLKSHNCTTAAEHRLESRTASFSVASRKVVESVDEIANFSANPSNGEYVVCEGSEGGTTNCSNPNASLSRNTSLSLSTSQESLQGNDCGGSLTYHRYYHVFREGELDHLIDKYVDNLHIISSFYDHANWCIIAEKVQVWTI